MFIIDYHREVNFNKHQLLPADTYDNIITGEHLVTTLHSSLPKLSSNRPRKYSTLTAMRSQAHSSRRFHIKMILVCEVNKRIEHKSEKLKNLRRRGTWELVLEDDESPGSSIISDLFYSRNDLVLMDNVMRRRKTRSRFNKRSPKFNTFIDPNRCYKGIRRLDRSNYRIVPPISK